MAGFNRLAKKYCGVAVKILDGVSGIKKSLAVAAALTFNFRVTA